MKKRVSIIIFSLKGSFENFESCSRTVKNRFSRQSEVFTQVWKSLRNLIFFSKNPQILPTVMRSAVLTTMSKKGWKKANKFHEMLANLYELLSIFDKKNCTKSSKVQVEGGVQIWQQHWLSLLKDQKRALHIRSSKELPMFSNHVFSRGNATCSNDSSGQTFVPKSRNFQLKVKKHKKHWKKFKN